MTKEEKRILFEMNENKARSPFSPADLINGIAKGDQGIIENLVVKGYIQEIPTDMGFRGLPYSIKFYRLSEKGLALKYNFFSRIWFNVKSEIAVFVGVTSIIFSTISIIISIYSKR